MSHLSNQVLYSLWYTNIFLVLGCLGLSHSNYTDLLNIALQMRETIGLQLILIWFLLTQILAMCSFIALYIKQGVAMVNQPCSKWTRWFLNGLTVSGNKEAVSHRWCPWWPHGPGQAIRARRTRESSGPYNTERFLLFLQRAVLSLHN